MNMEQNFSQNAPALVSIVAPAYNEEKNLPALYARVRAVMEKEGRDFELIVVENGSSDSSLAILKSLRAKDSRVNFLSLSRNFGHQGALIAGLEYSRGDAVISMDADLQHPPEVIPEMLKLWDQGYDVVYTVKQENKAQPLIRRALDRMFYRIINKLSGIELHGQSDFRLLGRKALNELCKLPERNKFLRGLSSWIGLKQAGISYRVNPRAAGSSKFKFIHLIELGIDGIFSFSIIPLRIFTIFGILMSAGSFLYGLYLLGLTAFINLTGSGLSMPSGWATLAVTLLFFGGVQLIGIGLLGEYLGRVYDEVKKRPVYIVKEASLLKDEASDKRSEPCKA